MFVKKTIIALVLLGLVLGGAYWLFHYKFARISVLFIYVFIYVLVEIISGTDRQVIAQREKFSHWPTSGPIGRFGQQGLIIAFTISGMFCLLNPFQLWQHLRVMAGNTRHLFNRSRLINRADDYKSEVEYSLPFAGDWLVYNGGTTAISSHSWGVIAQRYAYDFVIADASFARHTGKGTKVTDYFCYGKDILAAADGEVVKVVSSSRNAPFTGYGILDFFTSNFIGNYVVIRHTSNEFSFYAHLRKGSIPVKEKEKVRRGQVIGSCGHSGHSSEPHLHFHVQDRKDFYTARGLPARFSHVNIDGESCNGCFLQAGNRVINKI